MTIFGARYKCVKMIWDVWKELGKIHMLHRNIKIKLKFCYADIWHKIHIFARGAVWFKTTPWYFWCQTYINFLHLEWCSSVRPPWLEPSSLYVPNNPPQLEFLEKSSVLRSRFAFHAIETANQTNLLWNLKQSVKFLLFMMSCTFSKHSEKTESFQGNQGFLEKNKNFKIQDSGTSGL